MSACGRFAAWRVLVAIFFVACQAHRVHTVSEVVENSDAEVITLSLAMTALKWALVSKNAAQGAAAVYTHFRTRKDFEDTSNAAIEDFNRLLSNIAAKGGLTSGEILRSQYLEFKVLRDSFNDIKKFCQPAEGLLHLIVSLFWGDVDAHLAANITDKVDHVQAVFSKVANDFFCSHFEQVLSRELVALGTLLRDFEVTSSKKWFPRRSLPNRILAGKSFETLTQVYGLSKREAKHVKWKEARSALSIGGDLWINDHSEFKDTFLSDTSVPSANKTALEVGIREVRLLFGEMSQVSAQCHARAKVLFCKHTGIKYAKKSGCQLAQQDETSDAPLTYPLCARFPSACKLKSQPWPWLVYIQQHLAKYKWLQLHFNDVLAFIPSPSSFIWIAVRLATSAKQRHAELCGAVWKLLRDENVSQAEVPSFKLGDTRKATRPQVDDGVSLLVPILPETFSGE